MHSVEVHMPAAMPTMNLKLTDAFEEVNQINGTSTLQIGFMSEGIKRRPSPASVGIDV